MMQFHSRLFNTIMIIPQINVTCKQIVQTVFSSIVNSAGEQRTASDKNQEGFPIHDGFNFLFLGFTATNILRLS